MSSTKRTVVGMCGVLAAVGVHYLLYLTALSSWMYDLKHAKRPEAVGAGANTGTPQGISVERLIQVMLTSELEPLAPLTVESAHLEEPKPQSVLAITGLDELPMPQIQIEAPGDDPQDLEAQMLARAKQAGIYDSQIRARIQRSWSLPVHSGAIGFSCSAQVHQRADGHIDEVSLDLARCNGTPEVQQSLVDAIFRASPLPIPSGPSIFVERFSMVFRGDESTK